MRRSKHRRSGGMSRDALSNAVDLNAAAAIGNGDMHAVTTAMLGHGRRLHRLARSILKNDADAEDVVQETYARAYSRLGDFIGPHGFSAWLSTIAVNEALGRLRRQARMVSIEDRVSDSETDPGARWIETMQAEGLDPEMQLSNHQLGRLLKQAIDRLEGKFRNVFVMRAIKGMSIADTAKALALPSATVKTRFHRACRKLQMALGRRLSGWYTPAGIAIDGAYRGRRADRLPRPLVRLPARAPDLHA